MTAHLVSRDHGRPARATPAIWAHRVGDPDAAVLHAGLLAGPPATMADLVAPARTALRRRPDGSATPR